MNRIDLYTQSKKRNHAGGGRFETMNHIELGSAKMSSDGLIMWAVGFFEISEV